jgi:hypothetical protein
MFAEAGSSINKLTNAEVEIAVKGLPGRRSNHKGRVPRFEQGREKEMVGHPDISRELVFSRQAALLREAREGRLAFSAYPANDGRPQSRWPFLGRLAQWLRPSEPTFACTEQECLPARQ